MTCGWCSEPATRQIKVGRKRVYVCRAHAAKYGPKRKPKPTPPPTEVTPPICSSCGAEITWVTLWKDGKVTSRMPVDRAPQNGREPRVGMVVRNPRTGLGMTLSRIALSKAAEWVRSGRANLHQSHFVTCSSAERHRKRAA